MLRFKFLHSVVRFYDLLENCAVGSTTNTSFSFIPKFIPAVFYMFSVTQWNIKRSQMGWGKCKKINFVNWNFVLLRFTSKSTQIFIQLNMMIFRGIVSEISFFLCLLMLHTHLAFWCMLVKTLLIVLQSVLAKNLLQSRF